MLGMRCVCKRMHGRRVVNVFPGAGDGRAVAEENHALCTMTMQQVRTWLAPCSQLILPATKCQTGTFRYPEHLCNDCCQHARQFQCLISSDGCAMTALAEQSTSRPRAPVDFKSQHLCWQSQWHAHTINGATPTADDAARVYTDAHANISTSGHPVFLKYLGMTGNIYG